MAYRMQRKHSVCFRYPKAMYSQLYEECFDQDIENTLQPAQLSASGTMTPVPEIPMLRGEETVVLKFTIQRKER